MKIITTAITKGGTGKTTTAAALAQAAAAEGQKVLAVDCDPQGNLGTILGGTPGPGVLELLHGGEAAQLIQRTPQGIDLLAASPDLFAEGSAAGSARRLRSGLEPVKRKYDLAIIDTGPSLGELVYNAIFAASGLLIPLEADMNALQGLRQVLAIAGQLQQQGNPRLKVYGCILTRYDGRSKLARQLREIIGREGEAAGAPLLAAIRAGIAIREAQALRRSLYDYAPKSKPALDYLALYHKITEG